MKSTILSILVGLGLLTVSSLSFADCPQPNEIQMDANKYWVSQAGADTWKSQQPASAGRQIDTFKQAFTVAYDTTDYPPTIYKGMVCMYKDNTGKLVQLIEMTPRIHQLREFGVGHWQRMTTIYANCMADDIRSCSFS
ncbi:MAG: DUF3757 domain-containing protein [Coxiellaceae bacterium]|nr:DUF3757 domain-containing protein [Coxiellaceae bacterium]